MPSDPAQIRRLLDRCREVLGLVSDAETIRRVTEYAQELQTALDATLVSEERGADGRETV